MLKRLVLLTTLSLVSMLPVWAAQNDYSDWGNTMDGELTLGDHPNQNNVVSVMDRYSISDLSDGQLLQIYAQGNSLDDIYLEIRDVDGALRYSADDLELSDSLDAYIQFTFQQGDYLTISSNSPSRWNGTGSYTIYIDQPAVLTDINLPPKFVLDETDFSIYESESFSLSVLAQDPEFSQIEYSVNNSWLSIDKNSGLLSGTSSAADIGEHAIAVSAFDGNSTQTQLLNITVLPIIYSPTAIEVSNIYVLTSDATDPSLMAFLDATDFDSNLFTFTLEGAGFTDNQYFSIFNDFLYVNDPSVMLDGEYEINIKVEDEAGLTFEQRFVLQTDVDTDNDGVMDSIELEQGTDPHYRLDFLDEDLDGIPDYIAFSEPVLFDDANADGFTDYFEKYPLSFACDGSAYFTDRSTIYRVDTSVSPYNFWDNILHFRRKLNEPDYVAEHNDDSGVLNINALGFNSQDGFLYALDGANSLIRFEAATNNNTTIFVNYSWNSIRFENLGKVEGLLGHSYTTGAFDLEGNYYVVSPDGLVTIDIETQTSTIKPLKPDASVPKVEGPNDTYIDAKYKGADMTFNKRDGLLYSLNWKKLFIINPITGDWTTKLVNIDDAFAQANIEYLANNNLINEPLDYSDTFGSAWIDSLGRLFVFQNNSGFVFRMDDLTTDIVDVEYSGKSSPSNQNDAASCSSNPILSHTISQGGSDVSEDLTQQVEVKSTVTHHYQLANGLLAGTEGADDFVVGLEDILDDGRYFIADSLLITGNENNEYTVNNYANTNELMIENLAVEPLSSVEISIDVYIPKLESGIIYNSAYLTGVISSLGGVNGKVESDHPGGQRPDPTPLNVLNIGSKYKIVGSVYWDQNQNQMKDDNEIVVPNANITLDNGDQSKSDELGEYQFNFLDDQAYSVTSAQSPYFNQVEGVTLEVLSFDETFIGELNIPMQSVSSISGVAFVDVNSNGKFDEGETILSNVEMVIDLEGDQDSIVVTTDENGKYTYSVIEGTYQLNVPMLDEYSLDKFSNLPITIFAGSNAIVNWPIENKGLDTDGDNIPDRFDIDDDNDGILDIDEDAYGSDDFDGDGIVNRLDSDSDNDGIFDLIEVGLAQYDVNSDGRIDMDEALESDSNLNGLIDVIEASTDQSIVVLNDHQCDLDSLPNPYDLDSDNDGLPDSYESALRTDQTSANSALLIALGLSVLDPDGDGKVNSAGSEDLNGNGVVDLVEQLLVSYNAVLIDSDFDDVADYCDTDSDGDGIADLHEVMGTTDLSGIDPNADGKVDDGSLWKDDNLNGLADHIEAMTQSPALRSQADDNNIQVSDAVDGFLSLIQIKQVSVDSDFDRDGYSDVVEVRFGGNPLNGAQAANTNGIPNWVENTDLLGDANNDSDNDGFSDLLESVIQTNPDEINVIDELYDAAYEHILDVNRYTDRSANPVIWIDLYDGVKPVLHFTRDTTQARFSVKQGNFHVFNDTRYGQMTPVYEWSSPNEQISALIQGQNQADLEIDVSMIDEGYYFVDVSVSFAGPFDLAYTSTLRQFFKVSDQASAEDFDQDHLVNEANDSGQNNANLGYLHGLSAGPSLYLKAASEIEVNGVLQSDVAIKLRAGQINQNQHVSFSNLQSSDMFELSMDSQGQLSQSQFVVFDELVDNYYDLEVINLPFVGASAQIVIPIAQQIEEGAGIWIKPGDPTQNQPFINMPLENVKSARRQGGNCPLPLSNDYNAGLNQGAQCILIILVDGGELEAEINESKNGMIKVLIGVDVGTFVPPAPPTSYNANTALRGFGSVNVWFLISCLSLLMLTLVPRVNSKENSHV